MITKTFPARPGLITLALGFAALGWEAKAQDMPPWRVELFGGYPYTPYPPLFTPAEGQVHGISFLGGSYSGWMNFVYSPTGLLTPLEGTIGIGHVWYLTPENTVFNPAYAETHDPLYHGFVFQEFPGVQTPQTAPFYLSFWLGNSYNPNAYLLFGWAKLENTPSGLVLRDQFIGGADGVVVGVPEPSTFALMAVGIGFILRLGRRLRCRL